MPERRVLAILCLAALVPVVAGDRVFALDAAPPADKSAPAPGVAMNSHYLDTALREITEEIEGGEGRWLLTWFDVDLLVVSDETADRMRVMTPIDDAATLDRDQLQFLLEVNFERALDAKYTIWEGQVWATFVHPLSWLTPEELKAGMRQVVSLNRTYGTEFTSSGSSFSPEIDPNR